MTSEVFAFGPEDPQEAAPTGVVAANPDGPAQEPDLTDAWHARRVAEELGGALEVGYFAAQDAGRERLGDVELRAVAECAERLRVLLARVLA